MNVFFKLVDKVFDKIMLIPWRIKYKIYRNKYQVDKSFGFNGPGVLIGGDGVLKLGANSYIGRYSSINVQEGTKVVVGNNCSISHFVKIYTHNANPENIINNLQDKGSIKGDVIIGNNCWIGASVFIKEGVQIGDNSVIGANSVVTKNIPSNSIAVGSPAKVIKSK